MRLRSSLPELEARSTEASAVLRELTPLEGIADADGLRDHLANIASKVDVSIFASPIHMGSMRC